MFPLWWEEKPAVERLIATIEDLVDHFPQLNQAELSAAAKLLFALKRLPRQTPGIRVRLKISYRDREDTFYGDVVIDELQLVIGGGGIDFTPRVGSDSWSVDPFVVRLDGFRSYGSLGSMSEWVNRMQIIIGEGAKCRVTFDDDSNEELIPWQAGPSQEDWNAVESQYE